MAMQVRGTMTVRQFIDLAISKGAELGDLGGHFEIGGLDGQFRRRYLVRKTRTTSYSLPIPGEGDDDMLLDPETVQNFRARLKV